MKLNFGNYFQELGGVISNILVSGLGGRKIDLDNAMEKVIKRLVNNKKAGKKVVIVGNGGSSTIANHMAVDLWKNGGLKAISFSDSALLTCVSNDFGYQHVFEKPITIFADK